MATSELIVQARVLTRNTGRKVVVIGVAEACDTARQPATEKKIPAVKRDPPFTGLCFKCQVPHMTRDCTDPRPVCYQCK